MKEVSIIIPVYNCEEYLVKCLDSIVHQTFMLSKIEVIMVNDGSIDKSALICSDYQKKYGWVFINRKHNKGLAYTRNEGISKSSSEFIVFLDSDDYLARDSIEKMMECIKTNNADMVISKLNSFNSCGEYGYYSDRYLKKSYFGSIYCNKKLLNCISVCGKIYRKSCVENIKFPNDLCHEDNYYTIMAMVNCDKIFVLSEYTYYRRIREGNNKSIMQNLNEDTFCDLIRNYEKAARDIVKSRKNLFVYDFMVKKSYNYIAKNIKLERKKKCVEVLNNFMVYLYMNGNIDFVMFLLLKIKYFLYCLIIDVYMFFIRV